MLVESSYCKPFRPRILLSTWFWSISPRKLRFSLSNLKLGVIIDRATPATQNGHDKSIRHSSHDSNLQQAHTFFLLKYNLYIFCLFIKYMYSAVCSHQMQSSSAGEWETSNGELIIIVEVLELRAQSGTENLRFSEHVVVYSSFTLLTFY